MNSDSTDLIQALAAVDKHLPRMVEDVLHGVMTRDRQHEFADLLITLAELLHRDASADEDLPTHASGGAPTSELQSPKNVPRNADREEQRP